MITLWLLIFRSFFIPFILPPSLSLFPFLSLLLSNFLPHSTQASGLVLRLTDSQIMPWVFPHRKLLPKQWSLGAQNFASCLQRFMTSAHSGKAGVIGRSSTDSPFFAFLFLCLLLLLTAFSSLTPSDLAFRDFRYTWRPWWLLAPLGGLLNDRYV